MTFESHERKGIPNLNASDEEWTRYWKSCSIGEVVSALENLIKTDRKERPIDNKHLYKRALECKEAINKIFHEIVDRNNKLIKDIELGRN